ncbi:MAG TPA: monofunctional biosynthetic peptidoglycan transglycosylase [Anaeromyxobacteraceae bacterium]|nr:monofunctional biosynthetic peptidoglycan transglycosylase [Anaeromyxobacteraceae bacterium]
MPARRLRLRSPLAMALGAAGAALALAAAILAFLWVSLPEVGWLASRDPRTTALVEQRRAEARRARRHEPSPPRMVPLSRIAPRLAEAVVLSEDAAFFGHAGFDFREIRNAVAESVERKRLGRGASTITQQLAKNLFLGSERSLSRKVKEAVLAVKLERALPKRRILGLYLNVAEWGEGVFGAEAASRSRFGVAAADLSTAQAAVLAAMLPAPRRADLSHPAPWLTQRARRVVDLLLQYQKIDAAEHRHASAELERILAGPLPPAGAPIEEPPEENGEVGPALELPTPALPEPVPAPEEPAPAPEGGWPDGG